MITLGVTQPQAILKFLCSDLVCRAQDGYTKSVFAELQTYINKSRSLVGLSPTLTVDGDIGVKTVASFIKLVEKLPARVSSGSSFEPFILVEGLNQIIPGPKVLAAHTIPILDSLKKYVASHQTVPVPKPITSVPAVSKPQVCPTGYLHNLKNECVLDITKQMPKCSSISNSNYVGNCWDDDTGYPMYNSGSGLSPQTENYPSQQLAPIKFKYANYILGGIAGSLVLLFILFRGK